jgi:hypothetical protein
MRNLMFLLFALFITTAAPAHAQEVPYVYYYTNTLNAFVIERADGTDSRVIAQGLMPTDPDDESWGRVSHRYYSFAGG